MCAHDGGEERRITTPPTNPATHSVVISTSSACTSAQADAVPPFGIGGIGGSRPKCLGTDRTDRTCARCQPNDAHGVNGNASQCNYGRAVYYTRGRRLPLPTDRAARIPGRCIFQASPSSGSACRECAGAVPAPLAFRSFSRVRSSSARAAVSFKYLPWLQAGFFT
jgi:hypothetical protein